MGWQGVVRCGVGRGGGMDIRMTGKRTFTRGQQYPWPVTNPGADIGLGG